MFYMNNMNINNMTDDNMNNINIMKKKNNFKNKSYKTRITDSIFYSTDKGYTCNNLRFNNNY